MPDDDDQDDAPTDASAPDAPDAPPPTVADQMAAGTAEYFRRAAEELARHGPAPATFADIAADAHRRRREAVASAADARGAAAHADAAAALARWRAWMGEDVVDLMRDEGVAVSADAATVLLDDPRGRRHAGLPRPVALFTEGAAAPTYRVRYPNDLQGTQSSAVVPAAELRGWLPALLHDLRGRAAGYRSWDADQEGVLAAAEAEAVAAGRLRAEDARLADALRDLADAAAAEWGAAAAVAAEACAWRWPDRRGEPYPLPLYEVEVIGGGAADEDGNVAVARDTYWSVGPEAVGGRWPLVLGGEVCPTRFVGDTALIRITERTFTEAGELPLDLKEDDWAEADARLRVHQGEGYDEDVTFSLGRGPFRYFRGDVPVAALRRLIDAAARRDGYDPHPFRDFAMPPRPSVEDVAPAGGREDAAAARILSVAAALRPPGYDAAPPDLTASGDRGDLLAAHQLLAVRTYPAVQAAMLDEAFGYLRRQHNVSAEQEAMPPFPPLRRVTDDPDIPM